MASGSEGAVFEPVDGQVFYLDKLSFKQLLRLLQVGREVPAAGGSGGANAGERVGVAAFAYGSVTVGDAQRLLDEGLRVVFDGDSRQVFAGDDDGFFDFYGNEIDTFIEVQVDASVESCAGGVR